MSTLSLPRRPDNESLSFYRVERSTTPELVRVRGIASARILVPVYLRHRPPIKGKTSDS